MTDNDRRGEVLAKLAKLNPTVVVLATLALFLAVLFAPDAVGGLLILLIAAGLGWLLSHTWPVLPSKARVLRVAVIVLLLAVAASKLL